MQAHDYNGLNEPQRSTSRHAAAALPRDGLRRSHTASPEHACADTATQTDAAHAASESHEAVPRAPAAAAAADDAHVAVISAAGASPARNTRSSRGRGRALLIRSRLPVRRIRWSSHYHVKPPTKCCHSLPAVAEDSDEAADAGAAPPSAAGRASAGRAMQPCSLCARCEKSSLRASIMSDARRAARHAVQLSSLPVWQDRSGNPSSYRVARLTTGDIWNWLDPATHARIRSRTAAVLHSRWQEAERQWLIESGSTQDEYSRLAAEAADEAVWAATSAEVRYDDESAADEDLQRAIELSLQADPDLQLAIQLSLDDALAAAAAPYD